MWLATNVATVQNMVVDSTYVYWTDATDTVSRVPMAGGPVEPIWPGQAKPWGLAVDDSYVYWSNQLGGAIRMGDKPRLFGLVPLVVRFKSRRTAPPNCQRASAGATDQRQFSNDETVVVCLLD
jgi:hypothetical protein